MSRQILQTLVFLLLSTVARAQFEWAKDIGGSSDDAGISCAFSPIGTCYVAGNFQGSATFGNANFTSKGQGDIFLSAYDQTGRLLWANQAGGPGDDHTGGVATDSSGNVYLTGGIAGSFANSATFGANTITTASVNGAMFIAKYDPTGALLWVKVAAGGYASSGTGCALDKNGNIYATGDLFGNAQFWDGYSAASVGQYDIYLAKVSPTGQMLWVTSLGTSSYFDFPSGIAVDDNSDCFVSGVLASDSFIAKYSTSGSQQWLTQTTAFGPWATWKVVSDGTGGVFFGGGFAGTGAVGSIQVASAGDQDCVVGRLDPTGKPTWATTFGGSSDDQINGLTRDQSGSILTTGFFQGSAKIGATTLTSSGGEDIFVAKFAADGTPQWSQRAGGTADDTANAIASSPGGILAVAGSFSDSANFGDIALTSAGGVDAFLVALSDTSVMPPTPCPSWQISASATTGDGFHQGNADEGIVPLTFGFNGASTRADGCALCAAAAMLTSFPGLESTTPLSLNKRLVMYTTPGARGYNDDENGNGDLLNWPLLSGATDDKITLVDQSTSSVITDLNQYLQSHICDLGDRVILDLFAFTNKNGTFVPDGDHFVLVTNQAQSDWLVFDPGWLHAFNSSGQEDPNQLSSLADHYMGFTTYDSHLHPTQWRFKFNAVRTYRAATAPVGTFNAVVHSPVELLLTDPAGRHTGYDPATGADIFEIPGSSYGRDFPIANADGDAITIGGESEVKTLCVNSPQGGTYWLQLIGTGVGTYTLDTFSLWPNGAGQQIATTAGVIDVGVTLTNQYFLKTPPSVKNWSFISNTFSLTFSTQPSVSYLIEGNSNLTSANWIALGTTNGTGTDAVFNQTVSNDTMFYRIVAK